MRKNAGPKPFCWAKPTCFHFSSSSFVVIFFLMMPGWVPARYHRRKANGLAFPKERNVRVLHCGHYYAFWEVHWPFYALKVSSGYTRKNQGRFLRSICTCPPNPFFGSIYSQKALKIFVRW
jgi:hypothetical protein